MKKINLRGVSEILNDNEMKDVRGGEWGEPPVIDFDAGAGSEDSGGGTGDCYTLRPCDATNDCMGRVCGEPCTQHSTGRIGKCIPWLCHTRWGIPWEYGTVCAVGLA